MPKSMKYYLFIKNCMTFSDLTNGQKHEFISKHFSRDCEVVLENIQSTDSPKRDNTYIDLTAYEKMDFSDTGETDYSSNKRIEDTSQISYCCSTCCAFFNNLEECKVHKHKPFCCKYFCAKCPKKFNTKNGLMVHIMQHDMRQPARILNPGICSIKSKALESDTEQYAREKNENNAQQATASALDKVPYTDSNLESKKIDTHNRDIITHVCSACCDGFTSLESLNDHKSLHNNSATNDVTVTVKKEIPDADYEEIFIKSEPLDSDVKIEDISRNYDESFNISGNFNSTIDATAPNVEAFNISGGKDCNLINNPLSVAQTVPPDIGAPPVVPMLMPILPECPPYFIYGNHVYIRVAQINTGPQVVAGTIGNPTVASSCPTQDVSQQKVASSDTAATVSAPTSSVPVEKSSQANQSPSKSIMPKPRKVPKRNNQKLQECKVQKPKEVNMPKRDNRKVVKFTVVPDKLQYKLVRDDSDDEVEMVSISETKPSSANAGVLRKTRSTSAKLKMQNDTQTQPINAKKESSQNSPSKASPKNNTKHVNQEAGRSRKQILDVATNLPAKRYVKIEGFSTFKLNPNVKDKSNKRISPSKASPRSTRKSENKPQTSTLERNRRSSPTNLETIAKITDIRSLSISAGGDNVAEVIDLSSGETEEIPSVKDKPTIPQVAEGNAPKEKEPSVLKNDDAILPSGDNKKTTNMNPPSIDTKNKARYRCSICKARFDNFPAVREHCREVHSLLNKS